MDVIHIIALLLQTIQVTVAPATPCATITPLHANTLFLSCTHTTAQQWHSRPKTSITIAECRTTTQSLASSATAHPQAF